MAPYTYKGGEAPRGVVDVVVDSSVTRIRDYAFHGKSSLATIQIPQSITSIGNYAFYGCSSLATIQIPQS
eukprot:CAMPEP_0195292330 /NCGR_PEP_ID=MMETSP0707-20130614/9021_1 /TAXON_ID=33640 /ORGANISM="Asterionellopsis glacialis, Strain CCMP134" /LENGTH=69 /DNA_ID=CAMNT_0040352757 /DNA_START=95 /DNA_END=300 /DNA_ORIENTATION=+